MIVALRAKNEVARDTFEFVLDLEGQELVFLPGQFFKLTLINPPITDARGNSRFFGFINSPSDKKSVTFITRAGQSAFKKVLFELPVGQKVDVGSPEGNVVLPKDTGKKLVCIAGGIGIVPFISILRFVRENKLPYGITLIYANRDSKSAPYLMELEGHRGIVPGFTFIPIMTQDIDWKGESRRINPQLLTEYFPNTPGFHVIITGTTRFVPQVMKAVKEAGIAMQDITIEMLTGY